jgi:putative ABC transport system permease protein
MIPNGLLHGGILAFIALGIMIPFKLLNLPDLTAEGAYPLGAVIASCFILSGLNPIAATLFACFLGGTLGIATAYIYLRFKIPTLLVGIILSIMVYSVNLRLMGKSNLALFYHVTLFQELPNSIFIKIGFIFSLFFILIAPLLHFFKTEVGLRFRAVGLNPHFAQRQGISLNSYMILGFFIGNALAALAGALMAQLQSYVDINMGVGIVIHALAALMIGECLVGTQTISRQLVAPFLGALVYQQIQAFALGIGFAPTDLKFLTGAIVLSIMMLRGKMLSLKA